MVTEAMLGEIFGELLKVVTEAKNKSDKYETELAKLKSTLESIKPIIQEIETLSIASNIPEQEIAKLKDELIKGTELVRKCSEVKCPCFKRVNYSDNLAKLNQSIDRFIKKVNVHAELIERGANMQTDDKKILEQVEERGANMQTDDKKILEQVEERGANMQTDDKKILEQVEIQTELIRDNKKIFEQVDIQTELRRDNKKIREQVDIQTELIRDNKKILEQVEEKKIDTVLGSVFAELLKVVTHVSTVYFKSELEKLKSTLESITPLIQEIEMLNIALNIPVQETAKLKEELIKGTELVRKCSERKCSCFRRVNYADKLIKLNQSIERICRVDMLTQLIRDNKKILLNVERQTELIKDNKKILEQAEERGVNMQTDNKKILEKVEEIGFNIQTELITDNKKTLEQVEEMRKKIDRDGAVSNRVEFDGPCLVPDPPEITPGLDAPLKELRTELLKDEGMQVIVVSAPGGAGKTTLVKKLCADNEIKDKFQENIFFVTVSKTPDVKIIVQRIFQHMKREVPTFQTDEAAINDLERLLKSIGQKAILLVLDDVWSESLVQKFKFNLPNYKILVTSRYVFPRFGPGHKLEPLNDEAAMILFRSSVTPQDREPYFFDENLAKKILRVCKGSPLTLTVAGRLLCGKPAAVMTRR